MAINNANSAAVAAGEAGERKGCGDQGWGWGLGVGGVAGAGDQQGPDSKV